MSPARATQLIVAVVFIGVLIASALALGDPWMLASVIAGAGIGVWIETRGAR